MRDTAPVQARYNPDAPRLGSGVYTLDDIRERCRVDDVSGCWHWAMAISDGGYAGGSRTPRVSMPPGVISPGYRTISVPRVVWLMGGRPLRPGWVVWRTCDHDDCCAPPHLRAGTKAAEGAWRSANGYLRGNPQRAAINTRNVARSQAIPAAVVREIEQRLAAGQRQADVEAALGVHVATISKIANGRHLHQRATVRAASVFSLGAAP